MRVTYYDKDGKVTETKDFGNKASDVVLNYDDTRLFFQIPESIMKPARSKKDRLERLYLLEQLRFLIEYDYELYTKSELCDKQDGEMSGYLRDIGCKDIEGMKPTQSDNDSNYQPNPVFAEMRDRLFRHVRQENGTNLSDIRHHLISRTKRNNIQYSRIVRDPQSKDSGYNQVYLYSDDLSPEVCYLLSLLAPLGDISEKQIYEESLFKDNKFLLSIARALYRTNGINRSVLYNLLRLFMPTTYKTTQLQGVLGFSTSTEIAQQNDSVIIKTIDELGKEIVSFDISKSDLADMFNILATEKPLLKEIEDKFRNEFDYYVNRWKDFRIQDMNRDMIKYFYSINQENWPRLLSKRFELLESEFNNHCNGNLYASPYCLYGIVLHYEAYDELSEISEPLTRDVIFCHTQNTTLERSPMYREMFYLNYIKSMICGLSFSEMQNIKALKMAENEARSEAIRKAIEYIRPIFAEEFLSTEITPPKMEENFKNILNIDEVKNLMCVNDLKKFKDFNMRMVLNIVGLLIDNGYFRPRTAKKINERLQKIHPEHGQRKDEILYYKNGSTYSYIQEYGLIPIIEKRFPKR